MKIVFIAFMVMCLPFILGAIAVLTMKGLFFLGGAEYDPEKAIDIALLVAGLLGVPATVVMLLIVEDIFE